MPIVQITPPEAATTTSDVTINNLQFPRALALLESAKKIVGQSTFLKAFPGNVNDTAEPALDPSLRRLTMLYYPRSKSSFWQSEGLSPSLFLWETLRYSVISTEIASRGRMSSYSAPKSCLESLRSELNSSSGFILSLLFRVSHSARVLNRREVLLRYEGIQLLAGSICSGISGDKDLLDATKRKGTLLPVVDRESDGEIFPDIQFWKQCADPVLAQDPFSSLMSALFCLPVQVITSTEFFVPVVHLFYIVCVIQALMTCYGEETFDRSSFRDCLLNDVCQEMSGYDIAREYFVSKYIDPSCNSKDMVRRLTHPYLRRCVLLWELLKSSSSAPLYDSSNIWEGSQLYLDSSTAEGNNSSLTMELDGVRELENLFQIQPLDLILKDERVHMLALRWSQHFCEDYRSRKYRGILFSTPAVPFKLMQLPAVYQILLERYVKMQCPDCGAVPDEPALCLLCGKVCSPSWKPCCRTGKCLNHASQCGAGVGIFLLVRKTTILLQRSARLAFWPSLYLDAFGEEDHEMHRGKPLYLSQERYAALTHLVASHSLDRTSEVLRQTTVNFYTSD